MSRWRSLCAVAAFLPGLAAAADSAMLELIMPDARSVMEINLDRMAAAPIGQSISPQMKTELASFRPTWQDPTTGSNGLDWSRYAQEVIFASGPPPAPGRIAPSLVIVHGLVDPAWIESLGALRGAKSNYLGVPMLSTGTGGPVVAFLEGSIAVIGQSADVKAAIRRRGQNTPPSPVLAEGLARFEGQYDAWMVSTGSVSAPAKSPVGLSLKWLEHLDSFTGGLRLSPDLELTADMTMRSEKDVADMAEELRWFAGVVQTQERTALSLEDMNFKADGKHISLSLQVPEQQIRSALQQRQTGQTAHFARAIRPPDIESGLPEPPTGTIRVQSSPADMGTIIVPVAKPGSGLVARPLVAAAMALVPSLAGTAILPLPHAIMAARMKTAQACLATLLLPLAAAPATTPALIPQPVSIEMRTGSFRLHPGVAIVAPPSSPEARQVAAYLASTLDAPTGWQLKISEAAFPLLRHNAIVLGLSAQAAAPAHPEGYQLLVTPRGVRIQAATPAGLFYGVQTFLQLLPPEIESRARSGAAWTVPALHIVDYPRYAWRGLLLDVSRHFFAKEFVEQYIDRMARYKMNVFHWHLTDDNGWRIEIKSLPQLTKVGAWRVPRLAKWGTREAPRDGEAATEGGFYTQNDIREVVAYAKQRFVTVVPEIEMPGHSLAALAAYPEISCTGGPFQVNPGSNFYTKIDNALCPGNEKTFEFIDQVVGEVATLFPSEFIHIGGDECFKGFWKACPKCQRRMADEHLSTPEELQSYLVRRAEKIVESKGKKLMGWDEILEGGLAPNAAVMSWRGMNGGIAAAKMNHQVVMTPTNFVYLDYYQGDPSLEPSTFSRLLLSTSYRFEPTPDGVDPKLILGGQGNLWTESVPTPRHAEYMTWPRAFALAEVLWSPKESRNWDSFTARVEKQFERLDAAQVNYARSMYDVTLTAVPAAAGKPALRMTTEIGGSDIYYTFDGTNPDPFTPKYNGDPVPVPGDASVVRAISYRAGRPSGRLLTLNVKDLIAHLDRK